MCFSIGWLINRGLCYQKDIIVLSCDFHSFGVFTENPPGCSAILPRHTGFARRQRHRPSGVLLSALQLCRDQPMWRTGGLGQCCWRLLWPIRPIQFFWYPLVLRGFSHVWPVLMFCICSLTLGSSLRWWEQDLKCIQNVIRILKRG